MFILGHTSGDTPVAWDPERDPNLLLSGKCASGKTASLVALTRQAAAAGWAVAGLASPRERLLWDLPGAVAFGTGEEFLGFLKALPEHRRKTLSLPPRPLLLVLDGGDALLTGRVGAKIAKHLVAATARSATSGIQLAIALQGTDVLHRLAPQLVAHLSAQVDCLANSPLPATGSTTQACYEQVLTCPSLAEAITYRPLDPTALSR